MTLVRAQSQKAVPTLTEVVEVGESIQGAESNSALFVSETTEALHSASEGEPGVAPASLSFDLTTTSFNSLDETNDLPDAANLVSSADFPGGREAPLPEMPAINEEQIVQRVLSELQRQTDMMLEFRIREALAPTLVKVSELLVRDVRSDLAATLRDIVSRAVAQELSRHRGR